MPYFPERAEVLKRDRIQYEKLFAAHGISRFREHGVRITIQPTKRINLLQYPLVPGTLIADMGFTALNDDQHEGVPHRNSRTKHVIFQAMGEFFDSVDSGKHPEPAFFEISDTNFRLVRFYDKWFGGNIAVNNSHSNYTTYDYAVPFAEAKKKFYSPETQLEIKALEKKRDIYDRTVYDLYPGLISVDPLLPDNETIASRSYWRWRYDCLQNEDLPYPGLLVPPFPYRAGMFPKTEQLRKNVPYFLHELIDRDFLADHHLDAEDLIPIKVGLSSACYWLPAMNNPEVLKFTYGDVGAQAEVLTEGRAHGVRFPEVKRMGSIISKRGPETSISFLLMEAVTETGAFSEETLYSIPLENKRLIEAAAEDSGRQLAKLHKVKTPYTHFGNLHRSGIRVHQQEYHVEPQETWNSFLINLMSPRIHNLQQSGYFQEFSDKSLASITTAVNTLPAQSPSYVHGDFEDYNTLISSHDPDTVVSTLFDPTPLIGSRYWDLAYLSHELDFAEIDSTYQKKVYEFQKRKLFYHAAVRGYEEAYGEKLDPTVLLATKFVIALCATEDFDKRKEIQRAAIAEELAQCYGRLLTNEPSIKVPVFVKPGINQ